MACTAIYGTDHRPAQIPAPVPPSSKTQLTQLGNEKFNIEAILRHIDAEAEGDYGGSERTQIRLVARLIRAQQAEIERLREEVRSQWHDGHAEGYRVGFEKAFKERCETPDPYAYVVDHDGWPKEVHEFRGDAEKVVAWLCQENDRPATVVPVYRAPVELKCLPVETPSKLADDTGGGCSVCGALPVVNVEGTYWLCGSCVAERISGSAEGKNEGNDK